MVSNQSYKFERSQNLISFFLQIPALPTQDPNWYTMLSAKLEPSQAKSLQQIMVTAEQKKGHRRSKEIEKSGGFRFPNQTVPASFNFSSPPSN